MSKASKAARVAKNNLKVAKNKSKFDAKIKGNTNGRLKKLLGFG